MQETRNEQVIHIRVDLIGEDAKQFVKLRKKRGLTYNSELFRVLVKEAQDREFKKEA